MKNIINGIIGILAAINKSVLGFLEKIADKITSSVETAVSKFILIVAILFFAIIIQTLWPGINMMVIIILLLGLYLIGVITKHSRFAATVFLVIWCLAASYLYVPGVNTMALSFAKKLSNYAWSKTRHEVDCEAIIQDGYDNANRNAADVTTEKIKAGDFDGALRIDDSLYNLKNKIDSSINNKKKPLETSEVKSLQERNAEYEVGVEAREEVFDRRKKIDKVLTKDLRNITENGDITRKEDDRDIARLVRENDTRSENLKDVVSGSEKMISEVFSGNGKIKEVPTGIRIRIGDRVIFTDVKGKVFAIGKTGENQIVNKLQFDGSSNAELMLYPKGPFSLRVTVIRAN